MNYLKSFFKYKHNTNVLLVKCDTYIGWVVKKYERRHFVTAAILD